jgi:hypothetical protein
MGRRYQSGDLDGGDEGDHRNDARIRGGSQRPTHDERLRLLERRY